MQNHIMHFYSVWKYYVHLLTLVKEHPVKADLLIKM